MTRKLENWIEGFVKYTDNLPSSELLRKWSAIACLSGALERKTWVHTLGADLYPNMYIILVAPPGIGKTILSSRVSRLWRGVDNLHVGSTSLTKASFVDEFDAAKRHIQRQNMIPAVLTFNSLQISIDELGVFLPQYDSDFMSMLTSAYDCGRYEEKRRGNDIHVVIERGQLTMYACTTPSYLNEFMPEGAWDQGFIARCLMIYSGEQKRTSLFSAERSDEKLFKSLQTDLIDVNKMAGEFAFEPDAQGAIDEWHLAGNPPAPTHPKLAYYLTRRTAHVLKLMMVCSAAEDNGLVITHANFEQSMDLLLEAEAIMPDIFRSMSSGGDTKVLKDCYHTAMELYNASGMKPIPEHKLVAFLSARVPSHAVERILGIMVLSRVFEKVEVNKLGPCYIPKVMEAM